MMIFEDRKDAGLQLANLLLQYRGDPDAVVIGLPRGGVVVAYEVAIALQLPLDVTVPRKMGSPYNPELAIGAVTENGQMILNEDIVRELDVSEGYIKQIAEQEKARAEMRLKTFRKGMPARDVKGKTVILVDDGLATGATMKAALAAMRAEGAGFVIVAVPVAPFETIEEFRNIADEVICVETPPFFHAIGQFYTEFDQVDDSVVIELLAKTRGKA